jgi:hypothetical protein
MVVCWSHEHVSHCECESNQIQILARLPMRYLIATVTAASRHTPIDLIPEFSRPFQHRMDAYGLLHRSRPQTGVLPVRRRAKVSWDWA